jgi:hypothetical protein
MYQKAQEKGRLPIYLLNRLWETCEIRDLETAAEVIKFINLLYGGMVRFTFEEYIPYSEYAPTVCQQSRPHL